MSLVIAELSEICNGEAINLHELTKFADLLLKIDAVIDNYLAIKTLLVVDELLELLNDCNKLDIKVIRFAIYDLLYVVDANVVLCDDLMSEYIKVKTFYDKLIGDQYVENKEIIARSYINLYSACNNVTIGDKFYTVSYYFAKCLVNIENYELAVESFTDCTEFTLNRRRHNEDLDQNQVTCFAVVSEDGTKFWYVDGELHNDCRVNGLLQPAIVELNGSKSWFIDNKRHNDDRVDGLLQPAAIDEDGSKFWYKNGVRHNDDKIDGLLQPAFVDVDGLTIWYVNGLQHNDSRVNGLLQPAVVCEDGTKEWRINGKLHNDDIIDGKLQPASITANGVEFWIDGVQC